MRDIIRKEIESKVVTQYGKRGIVLEKGAPLAVEDSELATAQKDRRILPVRAEEARMVEIDPDITRRCCPNRAEAPYPVPR